MLGPASVCHSRAGVMYHGFMGQQHHGEMSLSTRTPHRVWCVVGTVKNKEIAPTILKDRLYFHLHQPDFSFFNTFLSTAVIGFTGSNS